MDETKKPYQKPTLIERGTVEALTRAGYPCDEDEFQRAVS